MAVDNGSFQSRYFLESLGSVQKPKRRRKTAKVGERRRKTAKDGESRRKTPKDGGLRSNFEKFKQISQQNTYLSRKLHYC